MINIKEKLKDRKVRKVIYIAAPAVLDSFFVALAAMFDTVMVSSIGPTAVAAVGLTVQPKFLALAIFISMNVAVSSIIARRKGEEKRVSANQVFLLCMIITIILGIVISILCVVFADQLMNLCGSSSDTHNSSKQYFTIIMSGIIFNILSLVINAAQRGTGNTRITFVSNFIFTAFKVILNYLFIFGKIGLPEMGINGAAISTIISTFIACLISVYSLFIKDSYISVIYIFRHKVKLSFDNLSSITKVTINVFVEQLLIRVGLMATSVMAARLGTNAFAAHQIGINILIITFSLGDGMQVAAVSLIGESLGKKNKELAKEYSTICQYIGRIIAVIVAISLLVCGRKIYNGLFDDGVIIDFGINIVRLLVVIVVLQISQVIYTGCLRGAGDLLFTMIASTISVTIVRTIVSYIFGFEIGMGITGVWIGLLADQVCRLVFTKIRFNSDKWLNYAI